MTALARDVGQLLWVGFHGTAPPPELVRAIGAGEVGAVIVFKRNFVVTGGAELAAGGGAAASGGAAAAHEQVDLEAVAELHRALHAAAPAGAPVWVAMDQEGGTVQRVRAPATVWPAMLAHDRLASPADVETAAEVGAALGREIAALGVDVDFAPVLDVHTNPDNPVIGERAFGRDADAVTRRALAFARGLEAAGVLPCGKHFPGHGDTATDSHFELPRIDHDRARLAAVELAPFAAAARADLPMIMTAHVVFAALDPDQPATLSHRVITDVLRGSLGFAGVIVSDDLDMKSIVDHIGPGDAAVRAIRAGCDSLLICRDEAHQREAHAALVHAGETDAELRRRIGESAARIHAAKQRGARARAAAGPIARDVIGNPAHRALAARLAR